MNYEPIWIKLRQEMKRLKDQGVTVFHPVIVLGYMDFLEQAAREKEGRKNEAIT